MVVETDQLRHNAPPEVVAGNGRPRMLGRPPGVTGHRILGAIERLQAKGAGGRRAGALKRHSTF